MYAVVKFDVDGAIEAVPRNWIEDGFAYFPKKKAGLERAVKQSSEPCKEWTKYEFQLIKYYGRRGYFSSISYLPKFHRKCEKTFILIISSCEIKCRSIYFYYDFQMTTTKLLQPRSTISQIC